MACMPIDATVCVDLLCGYNLILYHRWGGGGGEKLTLQLLFKTETLEWRTNV